MLILIFKFNFNDISFNDIYNPLYKCKNYNKIAEQFLIFYVSNRIY